MKNIAIAFAVCLALGATLLVKGQEKPADTPKPLREAQLLALVAGSVLPEDIVHFVSVRGLDFHPGDAYRAQLKAAGATPAVVAAVNAAKVIPAGASEHDTNPALLDHLVNASKLMNQKKYGDAATELSATLQGSFDKSDTGFVMGELLHREEDFGKSAEIYEQVLMDDSNYPSVHDKLSYALYKLGDLDEALSEGKKGAKDFADDPEAHKNIALAYDDMGSNQAAMDEYNEALRLKPDYALVYYDLGYYYDQREQYQQAIAEYRKSIALDPSSVLAYVNLGLDLESTGDISGAILEERKAKEMDPGNVRARMDLAHALVLSHSLGEAIDEYRELEVFAPDSAICHRCFAYALFDNYQFDEAEKELRKAIALDPTDADSYAGIGNIEEERKQYNAALADYERGANLDPTSVNARIGAGRVLLLQKQFPDACEMLKEAVEVAPENTQAHRLYAEALEASGNDPAAIAEFKVTIGLNRNQPGVMDELAADYEKTGDWVNALDMYHRAVTAQTSIENNSMINAMPYRSLAVSPQDAYEGARVRYAQHLGELKAAGKASEAAYLDKRVQAILADSSLSDQLDSAMAKGMDALKAQKADEAEEDYKAAVEIAQKLQPPDQRVVMAHWYLGSVYMNRQDFLDGEGEFEKSLQTATDLYGKDSPALTTPLQTLGMAALQQKDFVSAERYYNRALEINEKTFGESSHQVSMALIYATNVYIAQEKYNEAEPYLLQAVRIDEALYGSNSLNILTSVGTLAHLYELEGNWQSALPYEQQTDSIMEKQFGPDSPYLIRVLVPESKTLRKLGKTQEADQIDAHIKKLQTMAPAIGLGAQPVYGATASSTAPKTN